MNVTIKLLKLLYIKFATISAFFLTILMGISVPWAAFETPSYL